MAAMYWSACAGAFRILEVIASLAPLLGLFGTVLGMIEAFRQLEAAGNQVNPAILSGGIWQALLTTAVGLAVAMPVVAVLNWLERRVDALAHEMDSVVTRVFTEDLSTDLPEGGHDAGTGKDGERNAQDETDEPDRRRTAALSKASGLSNRSARKRPLVSLTPLIDVVFILLVFFMLATSFLDWRAIDLDAPVQAAAGNAADNALLVEIRAEACASPVRPSAWMCWPAALANNWRKSRISAC